MREKTSLGQKACMKKLQFPCMHSHGLYFSSIILVAWSFSYMDFMHKVYFSYKASTNQIWPVIDPHVQIDRPNRLIQNPKSARNSKSKIRSENPKSKIRNLKSENLKIRTVSKKVISSDHPRSASKHFNFEHLLKQFKLDHLAPHTLK